MRTLGGCVLVVAVLFGTGAPAIAQTTSGGTERWQYELTPYFWAAGMKGDVQSGALPKTSVDVDFSDIWDNLDFGAMGAFEARKGRWGLLFDAIYMKISTSATSSRSGPGPIGATLTATANLKLEQTMLAAAVAYRVSDGPTATDVIGGARYSKIDADASINASLFAQTGVVARSGDKDWVDPYIGVRVQHPIADRWTLVGYGDIGGFGVGSDFTWQALAGVNYDFSKTVSGKFGYRYLSVDYDKSGFLYDMDSYGLYAGVGFRF
jgi:opacity protein-like surface antigen